MTIKITSIEDVKQFANHLANDLHLNFHPDDDFLCYVTMIQNTPRLLARKLQNTMLS